MLKLVMKDLLAARWPLLLVLLFGILYPLQPFWPAEIVFLIGGLYGLIALFIIFFFEDRNKTEIQYLSMPVSRRTVVRARYLLGAIMILAGGAVASAVLLFSSLLSENVDLSAILTIEAAAAFLSISGFGLSLYLCFYHRFGFGRGAILFVFVFVAVMFPAVLGLKRAGRPLSIVGFLRDLRFSLGTPLFLAASAALIIGLVVLSLRLSQRFYARQEF